MPIQKQWFLDVILTVFLSNKMQNSIFMKKKITILNPFQPLVSVKDSSIFELRHVHCCKLGSQYNIKNIMANSAKSDEMACYKLSQLDLIWI